MKKTSFERIWDRYPRIVNYLLGIFVFLFSFFIYVQTLAPTVTAEDSGELITASYFLGIPHPPGYPTWCLLSHPFVYIPIGNIAWRVNLSSAFFASCSVLFIFLFLYKLTKSRIVSISSALLFAFSMEFWEQSVITEVYTLNTLFIILCLYILCLWTEDKNPKYLIHLAIIYGLSLGNHPTMFVIGPILAVFILLNNRINSQNIKLYTQCIIISLFAWCIVCSYLYIRSRANPPIDWGNPETLSNLFAVITRKQYSFMLTQYPRTLSRFLKQCYIFFWMGVNQFGSPLLFFLALISFLFILPKYKKWSVLLFVISFSTSLLAILVQNFNFDIEWQEVMSVFGIPAYLCMAIVLGILLGEVLKWLDIQSKKYYFPYILVLLLPLIPLYKNYERNDYSSFWFAHEFSENILNSMSKDAIFIPYTDHLSFPLLYLQKIESIREDITLARICGYLSPELFEGMDREQWKRYAPFPKGRYESELIGWLIDNTDKPIYSEQEVKVICETKGEWVPAGIIYRFQRENEVVPCSDVYWQKYHWKYIKEENINKPTASLIWLQIQWAKARDCFINGDKETAIKLINNGIKHYGKDDVILNNAGALCAKYKEYNYAKKFFEEAIKINSENKVLEKNFRKLIHKQKSAG